MKSVAVTGRFEIFVFSSLEVSTTQAMFYYEFSIERVVAPPHQAILLTKLEQ